MPTPSRRTALAALAFVALPLAFAPGLLWGEAFWLRDVWAYHWPLRDEVVQAWRELRWPLWSSAAGAGVPLAANPAVGACYPLNAVVALLPSGIGLAVLSWLHLAIAGLGARALARECGAQGAAAALGGVVYALSGPVIASLSTVTHTGAAAWLPVALLAAVRFDRTGAPAWAAAAGGALAMQVLGGTAQMALYTGVAMAGWLAAGGGGGAGSGGAAWGRRAGRLAIVAAAGLALSAVQILPALEWMGEVERGAGGRFPWSEAAAGSWSPLELLAALVAPGAVSTATQSGWSAWSGATPSYAVWGPLYGYERHYLAAAWCGALPLLLALAGSRPLERAGRGPLLLAVAGLWLALGRYGGLYWLLHQLPGFGGFRWPDKALPFFALGLACLAARGAHRWLTERPKGRFDGSDRRCAAVAGAWLACVALVAVWGVNADWSAMPDLAAYAAADRTQALLTAPFLVALATVAAWAARPGRLGGPAWAAPALLLAFTVADCVHLNGALGSTTGASSFRAPSLAGRQLPPAEGYRLLPVMNTRGDVHRRLVHSDVAAWNRHYRDRMRALGGLLEGRPVLESYDTSRLRGWHTMVRNAGARPHWYGALAVRDIVAEMDLGETGMERRQVTPDCILYRNPHVLPRARLTGAAESVASPAAARERCLDPAFPHRTRVTLAGAVPAGLSPEAAAAGSARITSDRGGEVAVATSATGSTLLVLADLAYPGWSVAVDGAPAELRTANGAFRAVVVPAGDHRVVFRLSRARCWWGLAIALAALAALASWGWLERRRHAAAVA